MNLQDCKDGVVFDTCAMINMSKERTLKTALQRLKQMRIPIILPEIVIHELSMKAANETIIATDALDVMYILKDFKYEVIRTYGSYKKDHDRSAKEIFYIPLCDINAWMEKQDKIYDREGVQWMECNFRDTNKTVMRLTDEKLIVGSIQARETADQILAAAALRLCRLGKSVGLVSNDNRLLGSFFASAMRVNIRGTYIVNTTMLYEDLAIKV